MRAAVFIAALVLLFGCVAYEDAHVRVVRTYVTDSAEKPIAAPGHKVLRIEFDAVLDGQINIAKAYFLRDGTCSIRTDFTFISSIWKIDSQSGMLEPVVFSDAKKSGRFVIFFIKERWHSKTGSRTRRRTSASYVSGCRAADFPRAMTPCRRRLPCRPNHNTDLLGSVVVRQV